MTEAESPGAFPDPQARDPYDDEALERVFTDDHLVTQEQLDQWKTGKMTTFPQGTKVMLEVDIPNPTSDTFARNKDPFIKVSLGPVELPKAVRGENRKMNVKRPPGKNFFLSGYRIGDKTPPDEEGVALLSPHQALDAVTGGDQTKLQTLLEGANVNPDTITGVNIFVGVRRPHYDRPVSGHIK